MKHLFVLLIICMSCMSMMAQQSDSDKINAIKMQSDTYLFVTGTSTKGEQQAADNARTLLPVEIEGWLRQTYRKADPVVLREIASESAAHTVAIPIRQHKLYRCFLYIKKADLRSPDAAPVTPTVAPAIPETTLVTPTATPVIPETIPVAADSTLAVGQSRESVIDTSSDAAAVVTTDAAAVVTTDAAAVVTTDATAVVTSDPTTDNTADKAMEQRVQRVHSTSNVMRLLYQLKDSHTLAQVGNTAAWPEGTTVYIFFIDYNNIVQRRVKLSDKGAVELSNEKDLDISIYKEKYNQCIWFTVKK